MPEKYEGLGISLLYPETWKLEEDVEAKSLTLETPSGAFLTLSTSEDLEADFVRAQKAMEAEYDEVETEECHSTLAAHALHGVVQRFVFLDLIVTSRLFKLDAEGKKYLIQIQGEDREVEQLQPVFDAILTSMCQSL